MVEKVFCGALCLPAALAVGLSLASAAEKTNTPPKQRALPRSDTRAPDTSKPVKVFILLGQSNLVGMGEIGPETAQGTLACRTKKEGKYPYLVDEEGDWRFARTSTTMMLA